jgi:hypothetical protein
MHVNLRIEEIIKINNCEIRYLSLYLLNFNLIKLSFNILKT